VRADTIRASGSGSASGSPKLVTTSVIGVFDRIATPFHRPSP
jgi:hypothetical protein